jgi:hypothetical protein
MIKRLGLLWLVLAVVTFVVFFTWVDWTACKRIADHGRPTFAKVVALHPYGQDAIACAYSVNGRTYEVTDDLWPPNPANEKAFTGESVAVYYDARDPSSAVLGAPGPLLRRDTTAILLTSVCFPTASVVWFYFVIIKRRRNSFGRPS